METVNPSTSNSMNLGPLFIALAAMLWATDAFVRTELEQKLSATQVVLIEHLLIVIIISPLVIRYIPKMVELNSKEIFAILFIGIGGSALATIALTEGFWVGGNFEFVAVVVFLQQTQPIIAVGLAHLLLKERLPRSYYWLALLSFFGVILIIFPTLTGGTNNISDLSNIFDNLQKEDGTRAALYGLAAAILWGSSTVFGRYLMEHGEQKPVYFQMTAYRFFIAFIFLAIITPFYSRADGYPSTDVALKSDIFIRLVYMAMIVGLLSLVLYYYGLKSTHASVSAIAELGFPFSFYILMPFRDIEYPETIQIIGSIILVIAATMMSYTYGKLDTEQQNVKTNPN